jgi:2-isopropylmalate synthase
MSEQILIFDTTLRDGEQAPGAAMTRAEKLEIARLLDDLGVDVIEAGFAASSRGDFEAVHAIAAQSQNAIVCTLSRAVRADLEIAAEALQPAQRRRIHTFISTSPLHMKFKLQMTPDQVYAAVVDSVTYARSLCEDIQWGCEDGTRSDRDFLCRCIEAAIKSGASTINLPDTVGYTVPEEFVDLINDIRNRVPNIDKVRLAVHCHDDLGMAVANSLAAIRAGARQIEGTINGIGERAGNAALEEIVMAIDVRRDVFKCHTGVKTERLAHISRLVSATTGFVVPPNKAIVGANAFAHESGIHQHGMIRHVGTYQIIEPQTVGVSQSTLVMGKHSGRHALKMKLREMGIDLDDRAFESVFVRFKAYADTRKTVSNDEIRALAEGELGLETAVDIELKTIFIHTDSDGPQVARLVVARDGRPCTVEARGRQPFEAVAAAFRQLHPHEARIVRYEVNLIWEGDAALAKATVQLGDDARSATGIAKNADTFTAFAEAYLAALARICLRCPVAKAFAPTSLPAVS